MSYNKSLPGILPNNPRYDTKLFILFTAAAVVLWMGLGSYSIYILDEARNAQAAREMLENNDFIVPTFNGELRSHKPPLHYYFMQAGYLALGINAWGARFFSAFMGLMTIVLTWYFVKRFTNREIAWWTALVLVSSTHFLFEFRLAVPDPYLIFFITAGLFLLYAYIKETNVKWLLLSAAALGLATLSKGPVALMLPGLAVFGWLIFEKKWKIILSWKWVLFALVIAGVTLPWFIAVHYATNGVFSKEFFLDHNVHRFEKPMEGHGGFFFIVPLFVLLGLLPFAVFVVETLKAKSIFKNNSLVNFSVFISLAFIVFFSVSGTKLPNYPMPCYPFMAFLFGFWINDVTHKASKVKLYPFFILVGLNLALLVVAFLAIQNEPTVENEKYWALVMLVPVISAAWSVYLFRKSGLKNALYLLAAGYFLFNILFLSGAYAAVYRHNPVASSLHLVANEQTVYAYKIYNPAFNFYLKQPVKVFQTTAELQQQLSLNKNIKIITREQFLEELSSLRLPILSRNRDLFENAVTVILGNYKP